ncbi:MAG: hypothetical protein R3C28_07310 [Pirellulaceae bacterium]
MSLVRQITIALVTSCLFANIADAEERIWHIKAFHPDGHVIDVKALWTRKETSMT